MGAELLFVLLLPGVFLTAAINFGLPIVVIGAIYFFFQLPREKKLKVLLIILILLAVLLGVAYYLGTTY